jgi:hypothetical protein
LQNEFRNSHFAGKGLGIVRQRVQASDDTGPFGEVALARIGHFRARLWAVRQPHRAADRSWDRRLSRRQSTLIARSKGNDVKQLDRSHGPKGPYFDARFSQALHRRKIRKLLIGRPLAQGLDSRLWHSPGACGQAQGALYRLPAFFTRNSLKDWWGLPQLGFWH